MYGNNELKNYWEDNKKVLKAESEALEDKKRIALIIKHIILMIII